MADYLLFLQQHVFSIVLVLAGLACIAVGLTKGFIKTALFAINLLFSTIAGIMLQQPIANGLQRIFPDDAYWQKPAAMISVILLFYLLAAFLFHPLLRDIQPKVHRHWTNKLAGVIPGTGMAIIACAVIAASAWSTAPLFQEHIAQHISQSPFLNRLAPIVADAGYWLSASEPMIPKTLANGADGSKSATIDLLHFTTQRAIARPELEIYLLGLLNEERIRNGKTPLQADSSLTQVGRIHAADMLSRGYFSHNTPEDKSPFDRLHQHGVRYLIAGENLAYASSISEAHLLLLSSPPHRSNMMHQQYHKAGMAVLDAGRQRLMIVQLFSN